MLARLGDWKIEYSVLAWLDGFLKTYMDNGSTMPMQIRFVGAAHLKFYGLFVAARKQVLGQQAGFGKVIVKAIQYGDCAS